jgi:hydrogenase maturation protein HypF
MSPAQTTVKRLAVTLEGIVQGVGFRPFVHHLARSFHLTGWVQNTTQGLKIEVEGEEDILKCFLDRLQTCHPQSGVIHQMKYAYQNPVGDDSFTIKSSLLEDVKSTPVLADLATCPECVSEIFDPNNRRYLYSFTNCTHCGPRFSIITTVPYDRRNTTMKNFTMCLACNEEYHNPNDRRFHAQPNACPDCGPEVSFWDAAGKTLSQHHAAILKAAEAIKNGAIVAIKGLGGFHLCADALNAQAIKILRQRKHRSHKPFALMFPNLTMLESFALIDSNERDVLTTPAAPIVLVRHIPSTPIAAEIAPENPLWGVMLPYTPLHHILMRALNQPIVATSGNVSDEPICFDEIQAVNKLRGIADYFLVHNRPIVRPVDDSVIKMINQQKMVIRRSRGYAPLPIRVPLNDKTVMALGGQLKNTVALKIHHNIYISPHLGDMEHLAARKFMDHAILSFQELYAPEINCIACDAHPDYVSTTKASQLKMLAPTICAVQHHYAHVISCMADNQIREPVLGLAWDGTGYGLDHTVWGGEFLVADYKEFVRVGSFHPFFLIGGEKAIREPRRAALGILWKLSDDPYKDFEDLPLFKNITQEEYQIFKQMRCQRINTPATSSVGRLFDALAALMGLYDRVSFEGQAAMALEYLCENQILLDHYPFEILEQNSLMLIDWRPMIQAIIQDMRSKMTPGSISLKFHNTLIEAALPIIKKIGIRNVLLTGGCFQNQYLAERMIHRIAEEGFVPYWHHDIPPNDGGLCVGQAIRASV